MKWCICASINSRTKCKLEFLLSLFKFVLRLVEQIFKIGRTRMYQQSSTNLVIFFKLFKLIKKSSIKTGTAACSTIVHTNLIPTKDLK